MRRRHTLIAGALTAALASAAAAPAALAAQSASAKAPVARSAGLLDGLGGSLGSLLGGLFGTSQQQQLQQLLSQLQNGAQPTAPALASLHTLLGQVAATPGLPAGVAALVAKVDALLQSGGSGALDPGLLAPVATLLHSLADTSGVPAPAASLLDQVAEVLSSGATPGLPVGQLSLDPGLTSVLSGVADVLASGAQPTGALLAPVVDLLDQVAATPDLPPAFADLVEQVGSEIDGTPGALDPLVTSQLSTLLSLISNTPGVPASMRSVIERTASSVSNTTQGGSGASATGGAKARKATRADRAVIKALHVNRKRTRVSARIACPKRAPTTCVTTSRATLGGSRAAIGKRVRIGRGKQKTVRLRIVRTAHASIAKQGGRLRFKVTTKFGARSFSAQRTLRVVQAIRGR